MKPSACPYVPLETRIEGGKEALKRAFWGNGRKGNEEFSQGPPFYFLQEMGVSGKGEGSVLSLFPLLFKGLYQFSVVETAGPGALVGRLRAQDPDLGDNALMAYSILDGEGAETFSISTDAQGRDGLLTIRKVCPTF